MAGVRMEVRGGRVLRTRLLKAKRAAERGGAIWDDIGHTVVNSVVENFDAGGRPRRWKANAPATVVRKARKSRGARRRRAIAENKPLIDTSVLVNSINYRASRDRVSIGTNVPYASYHQYGTRRFPARPFLLIQARDRVVIRRIIETRIMGAFR